MRKIIITILVTVFLCTVCACKELNSDNSIINSDNSITSESSSSISDDSSITSESSSSISDDSSINADELSKKYNEILTYYNTKIEYQYALANSYSHYMYPGSSAQYSAELDSIKKEQQSASMTYDKQIKSYYTLYLSYGYSSEAAKKLADQKARENYNATMSAISAKESDLSVQWEYRIKHDECMKRIEELENEKAQAIQELLNSKQ